MIRRSRVRKPGGCRFETGRRLDRIVGCERAQIAFGKQDEQLEIGDVLTRLRPGFDLDRMLSDGE